jgi:hypothetical protein
MMTGSGVTVEAVEPQFRHEMFLADVRGVELAFQVYHLSDQLFVYIGGGDGRLSDFAFGVKARGSLGGGGVATTTLLGTETSARASSDTARRLALKSGKSVAVSVNLPEGMEDLQGDAEKVLIRYLRENGALENELKSLEKALGGM